jgi:biopolymer transport protein ExbB
MSQGLSGLATIASVAPLVGAFSTLLGIVGSFQGCVGEKWAIYAAVLTRVSEALIPAVAGLLIAIPAWWFHQHFRSRVERFDAEMECACLELVNDLRADSRR